MDFLESGVLYVSEAVAFVPSVGKDVDGDLAADGKRQALKWITITFNRRQYQINRNGSFELNVSNASYRP